MVKCDPFDGVYSRFSLICSIALRHECIDFLLNCTTHLGLQLWLGRLSNSIRRGNSYGPRQSSQGHAQYSSPADRAVQASTLGAIWNSLSRFVAWSNDPFGSICLWSLHLNKMTAALILSLIYQFRKDARISQQRDAQRMTPLLWALMVGGREQRRFNGERISTFRSSLSRPKRVKTVSDTARWEHAE